jgi:transposase InsO family protein
MIGISKATYYHKPTRKERQLENDMDLKDVIENIHLELPGYGYRRIHEHLLREGKRINCKRIRRVMKEHSLLACVYKLMRARGSQAGLKLYHPNLIKGMKINGPNQVWATDFTYIRLAEEYAYLNAIIDVYTRKIVGWSISRDLSHKFCMDAMKIAIQNYNPPEGVIHHSDRDVQYSCIDYIEFLNHHKFQISMSRLATPEDNAYIESFFKTLKKEEVYFKGYKTMRDVIINLPKFIDEVYNKKRLHSGLGYKTPSEFEDEVLKINPADRPVLKLWGKAV